MEEFRKELTELCKKHGLENAAFCANKENCTTTFTIKSNVKLDKTLPKPKLFEWYWNSNVSGWRLYGVWIKQKYWIGFAIVKEEEEICQK